MPSLDAVPSEAPRRNDWPCIRTIRVDHHNLGRLRRGSHLLEETAIASRPQTRIHLADGGFAGVEFRPAPATAIGVDASAALNAPISGPVAISQRMPAVVWLRPGGNRDARQDRHASQGYPYRFRHHG
jgi:hypothetical protein